uniref:Uncharacterized protein n=1 Tax=Romanomermis culicivorax TaxID=13658 RepID=A0A915JKB2_ROMCU
MTKKENHATASLILVNGEDCDRSSTCQETRRRNFCSSSSIKLFEKGASITLKIQRSARPDQSDKHFGCHCFPIDEWDKEEKNWYQINKGKKRDIDLVNY